MSRDIVAAIISGHYEAAEAQCLLRAVRGDDRVVEFGAGLGFVSSLLSVNCHPISFDLVEADGTLIPLIEKTLSLNLVKAARVHHGIATNDPNILAAGSAGFARSSEFWASSASVSGDVIVPVVDANALLRECRASVVICDIEGGEAELFSKLDLSQVRLVCLEIHECLGATGVRELFERMHAHGLVYDGDLSLGNVVSFTRTSFGTRAT